MNSPEIDKIFDELRRAGHGSIVNFDVFNSGQPVEGIIFEPGPKRPPGFEAGVFVTVLSDPAHIYYLDPEASRQQGRLVVRRREIPVKELAPEARPEDLLKEFEHIRQAPDVHRGGGAAEEACSKHKGIVELE